MYSRSRILEAAYVGLALAAIAGCGRNDHTSVAQAAPDHPSPQGTPVSPLFPGGGSAPPDDPTGQRYAGDPHAMQKAHACSTGTTARVATSMAPAASVTTSTRSRR